MCTYRICNYNDSSEGRSFHFLVLPLDFFFVTSPCSWTMVAIFAIDNLASTLYGNSIELMTVSSASSVFFTVVRIPRITIWDSEKCFFLKPRSGCAILTCNGSRGLTCRQRQACQGSLLAHTICQTTIGSNDAWGPFVGVYH